MTILQNAINNWHTLRDNISDPSAETLSQTGVSCSYVLCVIIAKYVPIQRHFYDNKKTFYSQLNSAIPTVAIIESEMSLHAGQVKKLLRGQIIIAKVTLERAPGPRAVAINDSTDHFHIAQFAVYDEDIWIRPRLPRENE